MVVTVVEHGAGKSSKSEGRIVVERSNDTRWRTLENQVAGAYCIGPQIEKRTTPRCRVVADVSRIKKLFGKHSMYRANRSNGMVSEQRVQFFPLWMIAESKTFFNVPAGAIT